MITKILEFITQILIYINNIINIPAYNELIDLGQCTIFYDIYGI